MRSPFAVGSLQLLCMLLCVAALWLLLLWPLQLVCWLLRCCCRRTTTGAEQPQNSRPRCVLVTGASSGIGEAVARHYATLQGEEVLLALTGRNQQRLESVADECRKLGAQVVCRVVDVTDAPGMEAFIEEVHALRPLDIVLANAGVNFCTVGGHQQSFSQSCRDIFSINVDGVLNTVLPASALQAEVGRGTIAIVSSLAAYSHLYSIGDGEGSPYSATKAAVKMLGLHMRRRFAPKGVNVSVVCPGFVTSGMTKALNMGKLWMEIPAEEAAARIHEGLCHNDAIISFPKTVDTLSYIGSVFPEAVTEQAINLILAILGRKRKKRDVSTKED